MAETAYERAQVERDLADMETNGVPPHVADSLRLYAIHGLTPGSFTVACIENDLLNAVCRMGADLTAGHLVAIAKTLFNDFPSEAWGSAAKRAAWTARGGAAGSAQ